jgi:ferredoxin
MQNPDMHTVCVSFSDFDLIDKVVPLSGTELSHYDERVLRDYEYVYNDQYCRHGCIECSDKCPQNLPVSSIMRYAYYFEGQGREKEAMQKYAGLNGLDATNCLTCDAPCNGACPNNVDIQTQLLKAHNMLSFA